MNTANMIETTKANKLLYWSTAIVIFLVILLLQQQCDSNRNQSEALALQNALNDTLHHYKAKDGRNAARISLLETSKLEDFLNIKSKDSTIIRLQSLVKKYDKELRDRGIAGVIAIDTDINISTPTDPINPIKNDTVGNFIYPTYEASFNMGGWIYGNIIADKDSTGISATVKNKFDIIVGREKTGFLGLGKGKSFVDITLDNPYSEVKELRVYQKAEQGPNNFHIGPVAGGGLSSEFKPIFFVGVGIMWTPLSF